MAKIYGKDFPTFRLTDPTPPPPNIDRTEMSRRQIRREARRLKRIYGISTKYARVVARHLEEAGYNYDQ